ncbi:MAG: prepilin-type N-terminal cleavage/methylation domain-containing protein [Candidatus Vogelbacteria bacterium]|nr:prepilin-type N-terminal cleavage/methylation domain-containing protein [Candidatus Vogelbacteria bacterium]
MKRSGFTPLEVSPARSAPKGPKGGLLLTGFTLIELLVVIAIISLLSSIVLASLSQARGKAKAARAAVELHQMKTAVVSYNIDTNTSPPRIDVNGCGCYGTDAKDVFVTGNYQICDPSSGNLYARPSSWAGPYMSQWPTPQWGSNYAWDFYGIGNDEDSDLYLLSFENVPASKYKELIQLEEMLDPDTDGYLTNVGDIDGDFIDDLIDYPATVSGSVAWFSQGGPPGSDLKFHYAPFRGLLPKQDIEVTYNNYPRAIKLNCSF